jgi:universal stress protein family protein
VDVGDDGPHDGRVLHESDDAQPDAEKTIKRRGRVQLRSVVGNPSDEIVGVAKTTGAQLIVLGSRGIGRLQRLVLGSVSESVLLQSECTVVITKRSGRVSAACAESASTFCHEARRRNANNTEPARFVVMLLKAKGSILMSV